MLKLPPPIKPKPAEWRQILGRCGYPSEVVLLDFETFFDDEYSLRKMSTIEFVMDERYEELGCSIIHVKQPFEKPTANFWRGDDPVYLNYLKREYGPELDGLTVIAQNFAFDGTILVRKYGIVPKYPICTLSLARHENPRIKNDLASMNKRHGLPPKGETKDFKGIRLATITPEQEAALGNYANHDAWSEWQHFIRLMPRLSRPEVELRLIAHTLKIFWVPSLKVDLPGCENLAVKMDAEVDKVVEAVGHTRKDISGNITFSAILAKALDEAGDDIKQYQKQGKPKKDGTPVTLLAIAKADEQLEGLTAHQCPTVRKLINARVAIKSWPLHIKRVRAIAAQAKASGGLLCNPLKYCGAHTGRFSGGEGINTQNLSTKGEDLVTEIRHQIMAQDDEELVVVDAAAIEARGLAWIAGQWDLCKLFREGREVYCEYAAKMAGRALRKARKTDIPPVYAYYTRMRNMGKIQVLGCGYMMGADKCVSFAAAPPYRITLTLPEAMDLVKTYRESVPEITKFWRKIEQSFKYTARYHKPTQMDRGLKFHWEAEGDITVITLPNGRTLKYEGVRVSIVNMRESIWMPDPQKPGVRIHLYGGILTENVVQAFCRDILAEGLLACEDEGIPIVHHCHDELVARAKRGDGERVKKRMIEILSTSRDWCPEFPLSAEGAVAIRYIKP